MVQRAKGITFKNHAFTGVVDDAPPAASKPAARGGKGGAGKLTPEQAEAKKFKTLPLTVLRTASSYMKAKALAQQIVESTRNAMKEFIDRHPLSNDAATTDIDNPSAVPK
eukprot:1947745-Pyramimonas_sp.AAC.1